MYLQGDRETVPVATRINRYTHNKIQRILLETSHINVSDYLRDLIRRDLEARNKKEHENSNNQKLNSNWVFG